MKMRGSPSMPAPTGVAITLRLTHEDARKSLEPGCPGSNQTVLEIAAGT